MTFTPSRTRFQLPTTTTWHCLSDWLATDSATTPATGVWITANRAYYIPFVLDVAETAVEMFWSNGLTASGNVDVGIYSRAGTRLVSSGSTAMSGTSTIQIVNIADTSFGPGYFYLGMACDNTTAEFDRANPEADLMAGWGVKTETSAFPLPATATFSIAAANFLPFFGYTVRAL